MVIESVAGCVGRRGCCSRLSALLAPLTVQSQDPELDPVLVSNTGQTAGTALATTSEYATYAQSFRTGDHPDGYYLTSVDLGLAVEDGVTCKGRVVVLQRMDARWCRL